MSDSAQKTAGIPKRIAIPGGYTTCEIRQMPELFLLDQGTEPEFYESG